MATPPPLLEQDDARSNGALPGPVPRRSPHAHDGYRNVLDSSIDLVQSYRRSQSFIGENIPGSLSHSSFSSVFRSRRQAHDGEDYSQSGRDDARFSASFSSDDGQSDDDGSCHAQDLPPNSLLQGPPNSRASLGRSWLRRPSSTAPSASPSVFAPGLPLRSPSSVKFAGWAGERQSLGKSPTRESSRLLSSHHALRRYDSIPSDRSAVRESVAEEGSISSKILGHAADASLTAYGTSTFGQTLFNAFNVLCGVGLLSEPLAFATAGWVTSAGLFLFCALSTSYTAKLLARMMAEDGTLLTYNDICLKAFGRSMQYPIAALFCLELFALCVALIVIFGDSFETLFPTVSSNSFKLLAFCIVLPTVFMPFQILSYASLIGLASSLALVLAVLVDGLAKQDSPGSIFNPAPTSLSPSSRWGLSAGLMMSGFSGHSIMPSLARDMKNPQEFARVVDCAYLLAGLMYLAAGVAGYLMFGENVSQEITQDILKTQGFPVFINRLAIWMVGINPIAKFALSTRPLQVTIEHLLGLNPMPTLDSHEPDPRHEPSPPETPSLRKRSSLASDVQQISPHLKSVLPSPRPSLFAYVIKVFGQIICRVVVTALIVLVAVLLPDFERVMAFLGAFSAFVICIILPVLAELILTRNQQRSKTFLAINIFLFLVSVVMAAVGTMFSFL